MATETPETRLSKALAHPLRVRILEALDGRLRSPNQLSIQLDEPLGNVSYHCKTLVGFGCIELAKTEPRRGAVEHFYRSTGKAIIGGYTVSVLEAQMIGEAIKHSLDCAVVYAGGDDAAGRTKEERKELAALGRTLAKVGKPS